MDSYVVLTIIALVGSMACGMLTIPLVLDFCKRKGLYDLPNYRKVHKRAIPRMGGVVFLPSVLVGCIIAFFMARWQGVMRVELSLWTIYFLLGAIAIYFTGLIDDIVGLKALNKLVVQILAASALPLSGLYLTNLYGFFGIGEVSWWIGTLITIGIVVFISNAINLIDGIDGLAGSLSIIALAGFMLAFAHCGLWYFVVLIASMIGVILAYLYYNMYGDVNRNRKIFMGDTGSLSIGFILAFLCLKLTVPSSNTSITYSDQNILMAFTLVAVPVLDSCRVAFVRLWHRRSPIQPDKNHIHHKLLRAGLTHHQALFAIVALALFFCVANGLLRHVVSATFIVVADVACYAALHVLLNAAIVRRGGRATVF